MIPLFCIAVLVTEDIYDTKFAKDDFYNVISGPLPPLNVFSNFWNISFGNYFRDTEGKFRYFSFLHFFKTCVRVLVPLKFAAAETRVGGPDPPEGTLPFRLLERK